MTDPTNSFSFGSSAPQTSFTWNPGTTSSSGSGKKNSQRQVSSEEDKKQDQPHTFSFGSPAPWSSSSSSSWNAGATSSSLSWNPGATSSSVTPGSGRKKNKRTATSSFEGSYRDTTPTQDDVHEPSPRPDKKQMMFELVEEDSFQEDGMAPAPLDTDDQTLQDQESFFDLMRTFAQLNLPEDKKDPEQCPLCPKSFPLEQFAPHVLECIKQLDDIEREHQLQIDERLAEEMSREIHPEMVARMSEFEAPSHCPDGSNCIRTDAGHFQSLYHPTVPCPLCNVQFQIYQVNAHVNLCLLRGPEDNMWKKTAAPDPFPEDSDSDQEDEDEKKRNALIAKLTRANSEDDDDYKGLSARQIQAMSQMVLQEREKSVPDGLFQMLDSFKQLGFTAEALTKQLETTSPRKQQEKDAEKEI